MAVICSCNWLTFTQGRGGVYCTAGWSGGQKQWKRGEVVWLSNSQSSIWFALNSIWSGYEWVQQALCLMPCLLLLCCVRLSPPLSPQPPPPLPLPLLAPSRLSLCQGEHVENHIMCHLIIKYNDDTTTHCATRGGSRGRSPRGRGREKEGDGGEEDEGWDEPQYRH